MDDDKNITASDIQKLAEARADADQAKADIQQLAAVVILFGLLALSLLGYVVYLDNTLCVCGGS